MSFLFFPVWPNSKRNSFSHIDLFPIFIWNTGKLSQGIARIDLREEIRTRIMIKIAGSQKNCLSPFTFQKTILEWKWLQDHCWHSTAACQRPIPRLKPAAFYYLHEYCLKIPDSDSSKVGYRVRLNSASKDLRKWIKVFFFTFIKEITCWCPPYTSLFSSFTD